MTGNNRIIVNTIAQDIRTIANIGLSLYSTRIVIGVLGHADYGIYMLVAGVVSLLSYFTNSMVGTTQRYLSFSHGAGTDARSIFANSYLLNCLVGLAVAALLCSLTSAVFDYGILNINPEKIAEAKTVYVLVVMAVLLSFVTAPFKALLVARENIIYISVIEVLDGALKLGMVFVLYLVDEYRLPLYAFIIASVMMFHLVCLAAYGKTHYAECRLLPSLKAFDKSIQKKLLGFSLWMMYGSFCVFLRAQGVAVVLNRRFGTLINASYGIATQVLGSLLFLSSAILNAFTPQIVKAEGAGDRARMLRLSALASKYCFLLLAFVAIPAICEMPAILELWLGRVPQYAALFCQIQLVAAMCDQITIGLGVANQAIGHIKAYTLLTYTIKALTVPAVWVALECGMSVSFAISAYIVFEVFSAAVRLPYLHATAGLCIREYIGKVLWRVALPCAAMGATGWGMATRMPSFPLRFLATYAVAGVAGAVTVWLCAFEEKERQYLSQRLSAVRARFRRKESLTR